MKLRTTYPGFTEAVDSFFNQLIKKAVPHQVLSFSRRCLTDIHSESYSPDILYIWLDVRCKKSTIRRCLFSTGILVRVSIFLFAIIESLSCLRDGQYHLFMMQFLSSSLLHSADF